MDASKTEVSKENMPVVKKKKVPVVRQTLTSKYRMLKADPLLQYDLQKKLYSNQEPMITPLKDLVAVWDAGQVKSHVQSASSVPNLGREKKVTNAFKKPTVPLKTKVQNTNEKRGIVPQNKNESMTGSSRNPVKVNLFAKPKAPVQTKNVQKQTNTLQRSRFMSIDGVAPTASSTPRPPAKNTKQEVQNQPTTVTVATDIVDNAVVETEPVNNNVMEGDNLQLASEKNANLAPATPTRPSNIKPTILSNSASKEMTTNLTHWLNNRGKSLGDFRHLKCFGIKIDTSNKENVDVDLQPIEEEAKPIQDLALIASEALTDLHKLILEGYQPEQCEFWLQLIKQKYTQVQEQPEYWECRAALEQTKGNFKLAVECYKTAIVHGAEVQNVDKCLDQLLVKFSLLNIDNHNDGNHNKHRTTVEDAKHIFKSSIIQFAIQERIFKKQSKELNEKKKFIATPVRRSTRVSRSRYTSTPGVQIVATLQEVDPAIMDNLEFHSNNALRD